MIGSFLAELYFGKCILDRLAKSMCKKVWRAHFKCELLVNAPAALMSEAFGLQQYAFLPT